MTPEQVERTVEFILEHQAQAAVHIEQLSAAFKTEQEQRIKDQAQTEARTREVQSAIVILTELVQIQSHHLRRHEEEMKHYDEGQKEAIARLDQILRRLTDRN